jgi:hypothetical protein
MLAGVGTLMSFSGSGAPVPPPTTVIDFMTANVLADLPAGSTFTRASGATRINASGVTEAVASDVMRIQHNAAGVRLGVLLEEASTNLLFPSATLTTQAVTVTAAAHTLSFKGTGSVALSGVSTAGPLVGTGAANRVSLTFTPTAGSLTLTVTGSVTEAQIEVGPFPTSYIVTTAAAATRARDVLDFPPALLDPVTCSLSCRFSLARFGSPGSLAANSWVLTTDNATPNNAVRLQISTANIPTVLHVQAGVTLGPFSGTTTAADIKRTTCFGWGGGVVSCAWDGGAAAEAAGVSTLLALTAFKANQLRTNIPSGANCILQFVRVWKGQKLTAAQVQKESGKTA